MVCCLLFLFVAFWVFEWEERERVRMRGEEEEEEEEEEEMGGDGDLIGMPIRQTLFPIFLNSHNSRHHTPRRFKNLTRHPYRKRPPFPLYTSLQEFAMRYIKVTKDVHRQK